MDQLPVQRDDAELIAILLGDPDPFVQIADNRNPPKIDSTIPR